jgi:hypothetical protein
MSDKDGDDTGQTSGRDSGDDAKARFREALARKQGRQHPHESATEGGAKIHDERAAAGGKRTFRRKSGG